MSFLFYADITVQYWHLLQSNRYQQVTKTELKLSHHETLVFVSAIGVYWFGNPSSFIQMQSRRCQAIEQPLMVSGYFQFIDMKRCQQIPRGGESCGTMTS